MGFVVGIVRSADEAMNALREAGAPVMERAA
jgi:hypothetical protein